MAKRPRDSESAGSASGSAKKKLAKEQIIAKLADNIRKINKDDQADQTPAGEQQRVDEGDDEHEEDEDENSEDEQEDEEEKKKAAASKPVKSSLTAQDVQIARETAELFKSNIFKLQIDELMKEVKLKDTKVAKIEKFLHKLYDLIQDVPDLKNQSLDDAEMFFKNRSTVVPFNDPKPTNINYKFGYLKPENVSIVGSFGLKTAIQSNHGLSIDVNLTMPSGLFQPKDYLNYRALHKRAFYLGYFTEMIQEIFDNEGFDFLKLSYKYLNDNVLTPVLQIDATSKNLESEYNFFKTKFNINILIGFPFGVFDSKKLLPNKNCIRVQKDEEEIDLPPTPLYNASVLSLSCYDHYLKYLYATKKSTEQFKEACILGRLWLQQRGLSSTMENGGFGHFEFAVLTAALLNGGGNSGNKILLHGFSSYQLFKGVIKYLATEDLCTDNHLQFHSNFNEDDDESGQTSTKLIRGGFNVPTLFDKVTKINIFSKITKNSYNLLVQHAKKTLVLLNDVIKDRFDVLFLKNSNVEYLKYDLNLELNLTPNEDTNFGPFEKITFLTYDNFIANKISKLIEFGLSDRILGFNITFDRTMKFEVSKRKPSNHNKLCIKIGILINPSECEKLVIKGPKDSEDSVKFRSFWGNKSSLRRFKDGNIQHSVVWSGDSKTPLVLTIIKYILQTHIKPDLEIKSDIEKFNELLPVPNLPGSTKQSVISTVAFNGLLKSFDNLYKIFSKLDLPLQMKSLLPASSGLRYTSFLQPVPFAISQKDFFNELILQFESSSKWPDELSSLEKVKTAFLIKIVEILNKETNFTSYLTKEEDLIPYNFDITNLNILTDDGFGFKIRILTERDEILYLRAIENCDKDKRALLEKIYLTFNKSYMGSIIHTRTISSLSHQFQFYSPTVRLFKKWLDDQLLLCHLDEELVELLAIKPFIESEQYNPPSSVENGFLQILQFLSNWNWKEEPLILDLSKKQDVDDDKNYDILSKLSDKLTVQSYQEIKVKFDKLRKQDPQGVKVQFFVGSKNDSSGMLYSNDILLPIATRLTALSKVAIHMINKQGISSQTMKLLFTPSLGDYDFVIRLKAPFQLTSTAGVLTKSSFKNLTSMKYPDNYDVTSKFDPLLKFVQEMEHKFQSSVILSHHLHSINEAGENVITGLFLPQVVQTHKFKIQLGYNFQLNGDGENVVVNKRAIVEEIVAAGDDLVTGFDIK